jgi:hypothetical protein
MSDHERLQSQLDALGARRLSAVRAETPAPAFLQAVGRRRVQRRVRQAAAVSVCLLVAAVAFVSLREKPANAPKYTREPSPPTTVELRQDTPSLAANYAAWQRGEEPGLVSAGIPAKAAMPLSAGSLLSSDRMDPITQGR